jgi:hypothetical protein
METNKLTLEVSPTLSKSELARIKTVTNTFKRSGINLDFVAAGTTLYKSLANAKNRTRKNKSYIKKGIQFNFNEEAPRKTLVEVIQNESEFWEKWINTQKAYNDSRYNKDYRPSLHRPNPKGNYEIGNLAVVPYRQHQKENAICTNLIFSDDNGKLQIGLFDSVVEAQNGLNTNRNTINKLQKGSYELVGTGLTSIPMGKGEADTVEAKRMIAQFKLREQYEQQDNPNWQQFFKLVNE